MKSLLGDIRNLSELTEALTASQPDIVIHMAAQSLVRYSYMHPVETYMTNVMGTVNVLEACRSLECLKSLVIVTTDKCYENKFNETEPPKSQEQDCNSGFKEEDPMGGHDPYSNSKGCAELVTSAYRDSFFNVAGRVGIATARAGNVIGGGDWAKDRLIPDVFRSISKDEEVSVRNPRSIRPWQHVIEPLSGYLYLAEALYKKGSLMGEAFNFGPGVEDEKEVEWLVKEILSYYPQSKGYESAPSLNAPYEAGILKLNCSKAKQRLGWHPRWDLKTALKKTVEWNQAYEDNLTDPILPEKLKNICIQQINEYTKALHTL
jgi:CDP-glucose 4,6-dehydratase